MKSVCAAFLMIWLAGVLRAAASQDIVYAARYYTPPGRQRTSHFHLYRVNAAGGERVQITSGAEDDEAPVWSPDGRRVLFTRAGRSVCVVSSKGGPVRTLLATGPADGGEWGPYRWLPESRTIAIVHTDSGKTQAAAVYFINVRTGVQTRLGNAADYVLSPDGKNAALPGAGSVRIVDRQRGSQVRVAGGFQDPVWLDDETLIGLGSQTGAGRLWEVGRDGRELRRVAVPIPLKRPGDGEDLSVRAATLLPGPGRSVVEAVNNHDSTVGADFYFFRLNLAARTADFLVEGQFLAWSPLGTQFCTAPGRALAAYGKKRQVWVAPLRVGAPAKGFRTVTPGLVWVTGADWRRD